MPYEQPLKDTPQTLFLNDRKQTLQDEFSMAFKRLTESTRNSLGKVPGNADLAREIHLSDGEYSVHLLLTVSKVEED